ncbi:hypothetical protein LZ30DRAFT_46811 [Colletotrichum cereale]|nr:hypothetical protein LZ30DRAFT_46811 [Colletotrichum cereale]
MSSRMKSRLERRARSSHLTVLLDHHSPVRDAPKQRHLKRPQSFITAVTGIEVVRRKELGPWQKYILGLTVECLALSDFEIDCLSKVEPPPSTTTIISCCRQHSGITGEGRVYEASGLHSGGVELVGEFGEADGDSHPLAWRPWIRDFVKYQVSLRYGYRLPVHIIVRVLKQCQTGRIRFSALFCGSFSILAPSEGSPLVSRNTISKPAFLPQGIWGRRRCKGTPPFLGKPRQSRCKVVPKPRRSGPLVVAGSSKYGRF